ncbi:MAG: hypothetical protein EPN93_11740 [Spirochaetes bacterium]|nr:MAG: hypothetical protein EPN93_11740 [Spirochaetota bacterium]
MEDGRAAGAFVQHPAGATDTLTVQGLEPGAGYQVYALATDAACPDAKSCSAAFGAEGKAAV